MPEVIFNGPAGRLEGRYQPSKEKSAPIAIILHPHPQFGGTMNNQIVYQLFYMFQKRGFTTLRFNFRGIGRSQGEFDHGAGELSDAASALDWVQSVGGQLLNADATSNCSFCQYQVGDQFAATLGATWDFRWKGVGIVAGYTIGQLFLAYLAYWYFTEKGYGLGGGLVSGLVGKVKRFGKGRK